MNFITQRPLFTKVQWLFGLSFFFQALVTLLISIGVVPQQFAWLGVGIFLVILIVGGVRLASFYFLATLPLYILLPNSVFETLALWRPLATMLFLWWLATDFQEFIKDKQSHVGGVALPLQYLKKLWQRLSWWEYSLLLFIATMALSLFFAQFKGHGLKQVLFFINASLPYWVIVLSKEKYFNSKRDWKLLFGSLFAGIAGVVGLGYVQWIVFKLLGNYFFFWQYWAIHVTKAFYGEQLSEAVLRVNSWFTYEASNPGLRMFSILQDSHALAVFAAFGLCMLPILKYFYQTNWKQQWSSRKRIMFLSCYYLSLLGMATAVLWSGTRGMWVGVIVPLSFAFVFYACSWFRSIMRPLMVALSFIFVSFLLNQAYVMVAPHIFNTPKTNVLFERTKGLNDQDNVSNAGHVFIWKHSFEAMLHQPWGYGAGNFLTTMLEPNQQITSYEAVGDIVNKQYNIPLRYLTAHNTYLNIGVELGILGLAAFLLWWAIICIDTLRKIWAYRKHSTRIWIAASVIILFPLLWLHAYDLFDITFFYDRVLIIVFALLALLSLALRFINSKKNNL